MKTLAVAADEHGNQLRVWEGVKALQAAQARLKLANQALARTKRDSTGRRKAARRLGRVHGRVAAVRKALLHSISRRAREDVCGRRDRGPQRRRHAPQPEAGRYIADAGFGELRRQLEYKTAWYGTQLVVADRWFPSSKTCSGCGTVKPDLTLSDRVYECTGEHGCGLVIDRDLNAAINLARYTPPTDPWAPRLHRRYPRPPDRAYLSAPGWTGP